MSIRRRHGHGELITSALVGALGISAVLFGLWAFAGQPDVLAMLSP